MVIHTRSCLALGRLHALCARVQGLDDEEAVARVGRSFRSTVLALGGSQAPSTVFEQFRGRQPDPNALLRHTGLKD